MDRPIELRQLVARAAEALRSSPNPPQPREAEQLVFAATGLGVVDLLGRPERTVEPTAVERLDHLIERRLRGEPLQYIFGEWDFHGRTLRCDARALIPRPETELLVELVLESRPHARSLLDLGTGTGAIAITLALELPKVERAVAVDLSPAAAALARTNAANLGAPVRVVVSDWDRALAPGVLFDVVVSNPPYVDPADRASLAPEVRDFEPALALFARGSHPLAAVEAVLGVAGRRLVEGGVLAMEFGAGQGDEVRRLVLEHPFLELEEIRADLASIPRAALVRKCESR